MIERGQAVIHAVDVSEHYCVEIDTPQDLAAADQAVRQRERETPARPEQP
jgi:CTP:molybdopterin cytidylyltransferase MocA